jgi:hypothetical protein
MHSSDHARIGAVVSALAIAVLGRGRSLPEKLALWAYGVLFSVFVDLDHFAIARLKTGDWTHLRRAIVHPIWAFTSQEEVFPDVSMKLERLASHVVVGAVLTVALRPFGRLLSTLTAIALCAHLLADLIHEGRKLR